MATWGPTKIQAGTNNGYETPGGSVGSGTSAYAGAGYYAWFSWQAPDLSGVTIDSAFFRCYANEIETADLDWLRVDSDKTQKFSSSHKPSAMSYAASYAIASRIYNNNWYFGSGDTGEIDIKDGISALLPLTTSNWINIALYGVASPDLSIEAYDNAGSNEPTLTINYTDASGQPRMARAGGLWVPSHYAQGRRVF